MLLRFRMSAEKRYIKNKKKAEGRREKEMKSIKINNMPGPSVCDGRDGKPFAD